MSVLHYRIPLFCLGITLWILCCQYARKKCEEEDSPLTPGFAPSVYVIPIYEEEREEGEDDSHEAYAYPPYIDPPMYMSRNVSPPPPYRVWHWLHFVHIHTFIIILHDEAMHVF